MNTRVLITVGTMVFVNGEAIVTPLNRTGSFKCMLPNFLMMCTESLKLFDALVLIVDKVINVVLGSSISIGRHNLSPGYTALHSHASININPSAIYKGSWMIEVKHTICSFVRSKSLGPNIAGAKNLKNINPDTTEYLISFVWNNWHITVGHFRADVGLLSAKSLSNGGLKVSCKYLIPDMCIDSSIILDTKEFPRNIILLTKYKT
ncbi:hypothetical protein AGLY_001329 [Aphis glycines]|uniref:Uncharacterized protein n=1 Tax=Aphis glycines TaxID=307491 RepID=A0A6G0UBY7_APHGL|nr:hypothetical protein AGLY_001329 [Aphis glycines]